MTMLLKEEHERRMALYQKGLNDKEIGARLFLTPKTIVYWRQKNGLPPNRPRDTLTKQDLEVMEQMYHARASDSQIAKEIGRCVSTVRSWRRRNSLPGNYGKGGKPTWNS